VNGDLFAEQMISTDEKKGIFACVFYEGVGHEWIAKDLLFTSHKEGVVRVSTRLFNSDDRYGVGTCAKQPKRTNLHGY
jgi:beige protein homolog 1